MTRILKGTICLCALLTGCARPPGPLANRETYWTRAERFAGTQTNGPFTAYLDPGIVVRPGDDVPPNLRALSGHWQGWTGRNRSASIAISIDRIDKTSASGRYAHAAIENVNGNLSANRVLPLECTVADEAVLDCNLSRSGPAAFKVYLKLRADGALMFLYTANNDQGYYYGLLSHENSPRR